MHVEKLTKQVETHVAMIEEQQVELAALREETIQLRSDVEGYLATIAS